MQYNALSMDQELGANSEPKSTNMLIYSPTSINQPRLDYQVKGCVQKRHPPKEDRPERSANQIGAGSSSNTTFVDVA
jgi:hypothetical protein